MISDAEILAALSSHRMAGSTRVRVLDQAIGERGGVAVAAVAGRTMQSLAATLGGYKRGVRIRNRRRNNHRNAAPVPENCPPSGEPEPPICLEAADLASKSAAVGEPEPGAELAGSLAQAVSDVAASLQATGRLSLRATLQRHRIPNWFADAVKGAALARAGLPVPGSWKKALTGLSAGGGSVGQAASLTGLSLQYIQTVKCTCDAVGCDDHPALSPCPAALEPAARIPEDPSPRAVQDAEQALQAVHGAVSALQQALDGANARNAQLDEQLRTALQLDQARLEQADSAAEHLQAAQVRVAALEGQIAALKGELKTAGAETTRLNRANESQNTRIALLQHENKELQQFVDLADTVRIEEVQKAKEAVNREWEQRQQEWERRNKRLDNENFTLLDQRENDKKTIARLRSTITQMGGPCH